MPKKPNNYYYIPKWLFVLLLVVLILRIPSFFLPYSYGDELIYLSLGEAVRKGIALYSGIHDNKPPLLYLTAAVAGNLFWFKAILAFWSLGTVYIFWRLSEVLLPKTKKGQVLATCIFAVLTTIPLFEGQKANSENFMIGPIMLGFYLLLKGKPTYKKIVVSGLVFSVGALYKIPAAFDIPAIVFYWLATQKTLDKKAVVKISKRTLFLTIGFLLPILISFVWCYLQGAFKEYLIAAYLQNFDYLSSFRPGDVQKPFLVKNGPLLLRAVFVLAACVVLFWKRKKFSKKFLFTTSWLFLTLFAVTLSERPYPHYLLQSVPALSILLTTLFVSTKLEQLFTLIPLFFFTLVPYYYHFWHYETLSYYTRFINLASGRITENQYLDSFGGNVRRNYKLATHIAELTKPDEKIFIWGDGVPIYAMSKRLPPIKYVADYHISNFSSHSEVVAGLEKDMPAFILILPESSPPAELNSFIRNNYGQTEIIDGVEIWRLLGPKVRSLLAQ